jgi:hypothetical protein
LRRWPHRGPGIQAGAGVSWGFHQGMRNEYQTRGSVQTAGILGSYLLRGKHALVAVGGQAGSPEQILSIQEHLIQDKHAWGHNHRDGRHRGPAGEESPWVHSAGETGASLTGGRRLQRSDANSAPASHFPIGLNQPSGLQS